MLWQSWKTYDEHTHIWLIVCIYGLMCIYAILIIYNTYLVNALDYDDFDFPACPNVKTVSFGSQCITETMAVLNFCMFHIKYYFHRQQLFHDNVFHLHGIQNAILAKLEIEKNNWVSKIK